MDRRGLQAAIFIAAVVSLLTSVSASAGDTDPTFQTCLADCQKTGCVGDHCIPGCPPEADSDGMVTAPLELRLLRWDCESECKYQCMRDIQMPGVPQVQYYGKWPFIRVLGFQEIASSAFSILNFLATLYGLYTFLRLVYVKLPRKPMGNKGPLYEYSTLMAIYGLFALNSWLWSAIFHARDVWETQSGDYTSAIALIGISLLVCIIRISSLREEATRVMVAAPVIAFTTTHIFYMNFYTFDFDWNIVVCTSMGVTQLLLWTIWAIASRHPSAWKVLFVSGGTAFSLLLELYDFPPILGLFDAHSLWHAATVPFTLVWWSFLCDDASYRTEILLGMKRAGVESKKVR
ncbi:unnamed protein product [Closterium sp. NIES-64]|nr:unnamed protein product [Closterium sp. NIES-64]